MFCIWKVPKTSASAKITITTTKTISTIVLTSILKRIEMTVLNTVMIFRVLLFRIEKNDRGEKENVLVDSNLA